MQFMLKQAQEGPKRAPRRPQDGPRRPQDGPKTFPRRPRTTRRLPKTAPRPVITHVQKTMVFTSRNAPPGEPARTRTGSVVLVQGFARERLVENIEETKETVLLPKVSAKRRKTHGGLSWKDSETLQNTQGTLLERALNVLKTHGGLSWKGSETSQNTRGTLLEGP